MQAELLLGVAFLFVQHLQTLGGRFHRARIADEIRRRSLALEDRRDADRWFPDEPFPAGALVAPRFSRSLGLVGCDVHAHAMIRQRHLRGRNAEAIHLRPQQRQPLEIAVSLAFATFHRGRLPNRRKRVSRAHGGLF